MVKNTQKEKIGRGGTRQGSGAKPKYNQQTKTPNPMSQQIIDLINRAFDADGYLVNAKSRKNQTEAKQLLESGIDFYGELVNGWDTHNCLLIIAYPNKDL